MPLPNAEQDAKSSAKPVPLVGVVENQARTPGWPDSVLSALEEQGSPSFGNGAKHLHGAVSPYRAQKNAARFQAALPSIHKTKIGCYPFDSILMP
jgi:hypothetical protein